MISTDGGDVVGTGGVVVFAYLEGPGNSSSSLDSKSMPRNIGTTRV